MAESKTVHVIVARVIHGEGKAHQWAPVGYVDSLEEADAVLNQLLEKEREELHRAGDGGEHEYDVWPVADAWSVLEASAG